MVSQKKLSQVGDLIKTLQASTNFVLVKFDKTSHQSLESLRKELKKSSSSFKVLKNTLLQKAINKLSQTDKNLAKMKKDFFPLRENSAILTFQGDWSGGLNAFYKFIQNEKTLSFKVALLDKQVYSIDQVLKIAQLPPKNELVSTILRSLKNPASRLINSLKFSTAKLVFIISQRGGEK